MPSAVIDLTEMVRLAMQRPGQSRLFQAWESRAFIWVTSEQMLTELVEVTNRPRLQQMIRPMVRDALVKALRTRCRLVTPATEFPTVVILISKNHSHITIRKASSAWSKYYSDVFINLLRPLTFSSHPKDQKGLAIPVPPRWSLGPSP